MARHHGFYNLPEASRDWTSAQRESWTFGTHQDAHVRAFYVHQKAAMFGRASDDMAAAIARAGSVSAFLRGERGR